MAEYCDHRNEDGKCAIALQGEIATGSTNKECDIGDLKEYLGTSYKVRDRLCNRLASPINLDPEGDD